MPTAMMVAPLLRDERTLGVLSVLDRERRGGARWPSSSCSSSSPITRRWPPISTSARTRRPPRSGARSGTPRSCSSWSAGSRPAASRAAAAHGAGRASLDRAERRPGERQPRAGQRLGLAARRGVAADRLEEQLALERAEHGGLGRARRRRAGHVAQQRDLAELLPRALAPREPAVDLDLHRAGLDEVEPVARLALREDDLPGRDLAPLELAGQALEHRRSSRPNTGLARSSSSASGGTSPKPRRTGQASAATTGRSAPVATNAPRDAEPGYERRGDDAPDRDRADDEALDHAEDAREQLGGRRALEQREAGDVDHGVPHPRDEQGGDGDARVGEDTDGDQRRAPEREPDGEAGGEPAAGPSSAPTAAVPRIPPTATQLMSQPTPPSPRSRSRSASTTTSTLSTPHTKVCAETSASTSRSRRSAFTARRPSSTRRPIATLLRLRDGHVGRGLDPGHERGGGDEGRGGEEEHGARARERDEEPAERRSGEEPEPLEDAEGGVRSDELVGPSHELGQQRRAGGQEDDLGQRREPAEDQHGRDAQAGERGAAREREQHGARDSPSRS